MNNLTHEQKLIQTLNLIYLAKELKKVSIKKFNPNLSEKEVNQKVKEIFSNARN